MRSRCITLRLAPLTAAEIGQDLALRTEWTAAQKILVARLCGGAVGRARSFDLNGYLTARKDALLLLTTALGENDHSVLFRATEAYRAGGEGKAKTDLLIAVLYSILEDLMFLKAGSLESMRNQDLQTELAGHCRAGIALTGWCAPATGWARCRTECAATCCVHSRWTDSRAQFDSVTLCAKIFGVPAQSCWHP